MSGYLLDCSGYCVASVNWKRAPGNHQLLSARRSIDVMSVKRLQMLMALLGVGLVVAGCASGAAASATSSDVRPLSFNSGSSASSYGTKVSETGEVTVEVTPLNLGEQGAAIEPSLTERDVAGLYEDFVCPCCGDDIGSCTCDMAAERRGVVDKLVSAGSSDGEIYQAMYQTYGAEIFMDSELAAQVKADLIAELPAERPVLTLEPATVDLGSVPIATGAVTTTFTVRNVGQSELVITGLETTCGCTSAVLETSRGSSPVFGMHDNPSGWSETLAAGEEASLIATFDTQFHGPDATGEFQRTITIFSNDPLDARQQVSFVIEVTE